MQPDLGQTYPVDFAGHPPHMSAIDFVLWQRFRRQLPLPFLRLYFDVAVGDGAQPGGDLPENVRLAWERITRPRIDAVGQKNDSWTIIELRGAAGPGAVGSLMVYRDLWLDDPPDLYPVELWLVTDVFPTNLQKSLSLAGIKLFLV